MDSVTQFLMGAVVGQFVLGPKCKGRGALIGGLAGTIPDLDVLFFMKASFVDQLHVHRGFTHSVLFCIGAPFLFSWLSIRYISWVISFKRWCLFWFLVFFTHVFLDVMTTWGTQIFWPWPKRLALDSLFIIDPLVLIPLLIGCIWSFLTKKSKPAFFGCFACFFYLFFALSAHFVMHNKFEKAFLNQGYSTTKFMVRPTPFNTLFWSVTAQVPDDDLIMGYARLWDSVESITFSKKISRNSNEVALFVNDKNVQFLLSITNGFYVLKRSNHEFTIQDARFGRLAGWMFLESDDYVFNYVLDTQAWTWSQFRPAMPDMNAMLTSLIDNIRQ